MSDRGDGMKALLLVGLGGALGSMARYAVTVLMLQDASARFPFGTLAVNVLGCVIAGVLRACRNATAGPAPMRGCSCSRDCWAGSRRSPRSGWMRWR